MKIKKNENFYTKMLIFSYELEGNAVLESIKKGFLMIVPILFLGALALVIKSFPIPEFQEYLGKIWSGSLKMFLDGVYEATYGFLSIYLAISISMNYGKKLFHGNQFLQGLSIVLSVVCLTESLGLGREDFTYREFGNTGVFTAIVISILAPLFFSWIHRLISQYFSKRASSPEEIDERTLSTIVIPFVFCVILFFGMNILLYQTSGYGSLNELFAAFFGAAFQSMGTNLFSGLLFLFVSGMLWFLGIHGGNALELVSQNIFVPMNTNPGVIISKSFIDVFGLMGGCGATICLLLAIFFFARDKSHKNLAKAAAPTVLFNVNEIMVFGLPIIFNPIMLIPFVLTPMLSLTIAYCAAATGFMPIPSTMVEWTTPILFSGYAVTGSITGTVVQAVSILCGVAVYAPFVRLLEKVEKEREEFLIEEMEQLYRRSADQGSTAIHETQHHGIQRMGTTMIHALQQDIRNHNIVLGYQPQIDRCGQVMGAEALLRWEYNGRKIFPPLLVGLAKEEGIMDELSEAILQKSCQDVRKIIRQNPDFKISVNMVAEQLNDQMFVHTILRMAEEFELEKHICLEITEETNMDSLEHITENIRVMKKHGIRFAMDDFSMGHTSLKYLQESLFDYVKLDGSLVSGMMENQRSEEIVASIIHLGKILQFKVIAEYVDTKEKEQKLIELGCDYLQGYLYSPAVPFEEFDWSLL